PRASLQVRTIRDAEAEVGPADLVQLRLRALELAIAERDVLRDQAALISRRPDGVACGNEPAGLGVVFPVRAAGLPARLAGLWYRGKAPGFVRQASRRARHACGSREALRVRFLERARAAGRRLVVAVVRLPRAVDALTGRRAERMRLQRGRGGGGRGGGGPGSGGGIGGGGHLRVHRAAEEHDARQESDYYDLRWSKHQFRLPAPAWHLRGQRTP